MKGTKILSAALKPATTMNNAAMAIQEIQTGETRLRIIHYQVRREIVPAQPPV
jgi:hypothetical protein